MSEIQLQTRQIVAKVCGIKLEQIGNNDLLSKYADSLALIEIFVEVERQFGLDATEIEDDETFFQGIETIDDLAQLVWKLRTAEAAA